MDRKLPQELSDYLMGVSNEGFAKKETDSLNRLLAKFDSSVVNAAVDSIVRNGIPPHGRTCVLPISEIEENTWLLSLFKHHGKRQDREKPLPADSGTPPPKADPPDASSSGSP